MKAIRQAKTRGALVKLRNWWDARSKRNPPKVTPHASIKEKMADDRSAQAVMRKIAAR